MTHLPQTGERINLFLLNGDHQHGTMVDYRTDALGTPVVFSLETGVAFTSIIHVPWAAIAWWTTDDAPKLEALPG